MSSAHRSVPLPSMPAFSPDVALKRIILATDFSDAAKIATNIAVDLAMTHAAELLIVHAVDPMIATMDISPQVVINSTQGALGELTQSLEHKGVRVSSEMRLGKPWSVIDDVARETQADLVVLATHGRTGLAKFAMGGTADRVLRICTAPVLMIPVLREATTAAVAPTQWRHAVVGVDFSQESLAAASMAARLLHRSNQDHLTLALFHTVALTIEFHSPDTPIALPQHWDQAEADATKRLGQLADQWRSDRLDVRAATFRGYPSDGILHEARTAKSNLIALGTHGRGAVNRMLLGSVAERVLHHAPCPVLTVRHAEVAAAV